MLNPPTTKLSRSTFTVKEEVVATPWLCDFPTDFFVKLFMGVFPGSRNPMVIVKIVYIWNSRSLPLHIAVEPLHDLYFQGHGVVPQPSFVDFRTPWPKKHRYQHQDYPSRMFLAKKKTKNNKNSALWPFHLFAARGRATWETNWQMC